MAQYHDAASVTVLIDTDLKVFSEGEAIEGIRESFDEKAEEKIGVLINLRYERKD